MDIVSKKIESAIYLIILFMMNWRLILERPHIGVCSYYFPPEHNPEGFVTAKLVNALVNFDYKVSVISMKRGFAHNNRSRIRDLFRYFPKYFLTSINKDTVIIPEFVQINDYVIRGFQEFSSINRINAIDLVISRYEPIASSILSYWIYKEFKIPWINSINDPLPRKSRKSQGIKNLIGKHRDQFQKKWVERLIKCPDKLIFPSKRLMKQVICNESLLCEDTKMKTNIIAHIGGPISQTDKSSRGENYRHKKKSIPLIRHVGYLSDSRDPTTFLEALLRWDRSENTEKIQVEFIGNTSLQENILNLYKMKYSTKIDLRVISNVDQISSYKLMQEANICVLIEEPLDESPFLPSKFCDYAVAGCSVLALTSEKSTVRDYLDEFGGGIAINQGDIRGTYNAIFQLLHNKDYNPAKLARKFSSEEVGSLWDKEIKSLISAL